MANVAPDPVRCIDEKSRKKQHPRREVAHRRRRRRGRLGRPRRFPYHVAMARIGIFGGSFDPIHNGHLVVMCEAVEILRLDRLLCVPAARSPFKPRGTTWSDAVRLDAVREAVAPHPSIHVDDCELRRPAPSYTIDTIRDVAERHPGDDLFLLLGADSLGEFPKWKDIAAIVAAVTIAVAVRPGHVIDRTALAEALPGIRMVELPTTPTGVSSTLVRSRIRAGLPLLGYVPESVARRLADATPSA